MLPELAIVKAMPAIPEVTLQKSQYTLNMHWWAKLCNKFIACLPTAHCLHSQCIKGRISRKNQSLIFIVQQSKSDGVCAAEALWWYLMILLISWMVWGGFAIIWWRTAELFPNGLPLLHYTQTPQSLHRIMQQIKGPSYLQLQRR